MFEGSFDLDGYTFGSADDAVVVLVDGLDTGTAEVHTQDADLSRADGQAFGRDYLGAPTWQFTLGVRDDADVYARLAELAAAWRADRVRHTPGAVSELRFRRGGRDYVAFGRPRKFAVKPAAVADNEFQVVDCDFVLQDPYIYSAQEHSVSLTLLEPSGDGGLVLPAVLPFELGRSTSDRQGIVNIGGYQPTHLKVTINGPTVAGELSNPEVRAPGFFAKFDLVVGSGKRLVVDTRTRTALLDGVSVAGALTRASKLATKLQPGMTEISFKGSDPTNTSVATFAWRNAEYST